MAREGLPQPHTVEILVDGRPLNIDPTVAKRIVRVGARSVKNEAQGNMGNMMVSHRRGNEIAPRAWLEENAARDAAAALQDILE